MKQLGKKNLQGQLAPLFIGLALFVFTGCQKPTVTTTKGNGVELPPAIPQAPIHLIPQNTDLLTHYEKPGSPLHQSLEQAGIPTILPLEALNDFLGKISSNLLMTEFPLLADEITPETIETFQLTAPLTRGQAAQWLYQIQKNTTLDTNIPNTFDDVPNNHPFFAAIEWIRAGKGLQGKMAHGDYQFSPDKPILRKELCALAAWAQGEAATLSSMNTASASLQLAPFGKAPLDRFEKLAALDSLNAQEYKACAWAYHQDLFWTLYGLKPEVLRRKGFYPDKPVTRWEGLLWLFSDAVTPSNSAEGPKPVQHPAARS